jgi:outer membrane protein assembly factor BamB
VALLLIILPVVIASAYDWPQFGYNAQHNANDTQESIISKSNVTSLQKLFQVALPAGADGSPAYLDNVTTPSGVKDVVFVTTSFGHIVALDAHTGTQLWIHQNGPGSCKINNGTTTCYTTSSAVVDPNRQYVYSYGLEGYVHKYQVGDGTEITTGGWPELATRKAFDEKGSSALTVATAKSGQSYLYVSHGGYPGDNGDYQGHLTTINLSTGAQHVFNATCSDQIDVHFYETPATPDCSEVQTAIWPRPSVVYSADTDKIYTATGNGTYNPTTFAWGDTVLALNPDGTGSGNGNPIDSYTPINYQALQNGDTDIGSTNPAILPVFNGRHLAVQSGKDAKLRLIDLDNLSGQGGPGHTGGEVNTIINVPQGGEVLTQPAVWTDTTNNKIWVFVTNGNGVSGLQLITDSSNKPALTPVWQKTGGGSSPIVANGILYYAATGNLRALDPLTGTQLWNSTIIGNIHWSSPIVANGIVYVTDGGSNSNTGKLTAFSPGGTVPTTPPATTTTPTTTVTPPTAFSYNLPLLANGANGFTTFISVQNPQSTATVVTIQYYASDGTPIASDANGAIAPRSIWNPAQKFSTGQIGAAVLKSSQAVNIIVAEATQYGGSAYTASASNVSSLVSPLALNGAFGFTSQLNVFNPNAGAATVKVQFYGSDGTLQSAATQNFSLAGYAQKTIDEAAIGLPAGFNGWAQINGNGTNLAAQTLEQNPATRFVAISNAIAPTSGSLYATAVFNGAFGNFITGANLVNTSSAPVTATITYYNAAGTATAAPAFVIAPYAVQSIYHAATTGNGLPSGGLPAGFAGSAIVRVQGGPLVMAVNQDGGTTATGSRESGVYLAASVGRSTVGLPVMSNGFIGYYTGSTIVNSSSSPVTISLQYYDSTGVAVGAARSYTIAPYGSQFNFQGGDTPALPSGFYGTAVATITSGPANSLLSTVNALSSQFFYTYVEPVDASS